MEITKISVGQLYTQYQIIHIFAEFDKFENSGQKNPGELNLFSLTMTHFSIYSCCCIIYCLLVVAQTITLCTLSDDDVIVPYVWIYDA